MTARADKLLALHTSGKLLVLPNVWNPIGARVLEAGGYPAVATASAAVSASMGYADGERIRRSTLIDIVGRIAASVAVPVTADIEGGYASSLEELETTTRALLAVGVAGVNIEDSVKQEGRLRPVDEQCARISTVRRVAESAGVRLVINARVDCYLSPAFSSAEYATGETVVRAGAYADAGADCIYPIGPGDRATVRVLRERIGSPINILVTPKAAPLSVLAAMGVNRVSFGPFVFRACLSKLAAIADDLRDGNTDSCFDAMLSGEVVRGYLRDEHE